MDVVVSAGPAHQTSKPEQSEKTPRKIIIIVITIAGSLVVRRYIHRVVGGYVDGVACIAALGERRR